MNLTQSQKSLLIQLQWFTLPITENAKHGDDISVLHELGLITRRDKFSGWRASDHGSDVLDALELSGKL